LAGTKKGFGRADGSLGGMELMLSGSIMVPLYTLRNG
jgi:hypothetical protein